jgi:hypothetical protein
VVNVAKWELILTFPPKAKSLMDTRLMRMPLGVMAQRINSIMDGTAKQDDLRYVIYSLHDYQIANLLEYLNLSDLHYDDVPYSS